MEFPWENLNKPLMGDLEDFLIGKSDGEVLV